MGNRRGRKGHGEESEHDMRVGQTTKYIFRNGDASMNVSAGDVCG